MASLRRAAVLLAAVVALSAALAAGGPQAAQANVACDVAGAVAAPVTGAAGIGNPAGDACNVLGDSALGAVGGAVEDAVSAVGEGVFEQITSWASEGAVWLLGEVVKLTEKTTSPDLLSKGFLRQYRQMVSIAVVFAAMMLILAVFESLGRGDAGMLLRVFFVTLPIAAIATSAAFVLVQLLIATTDGFSEFIARSTAEDARHFFKGAIEGLAAAGGTAGAAGGEVGATAGVTGAAGPPAGAAAGAVAVPLFVGFIAAVLAAVAAFLLWIELLMRDAAIYAVAAFMPLGIAASIWPRWKIVMQRTGELIFAVVSAKFVIVSIIALAASLAADPGGDIEQVFAAGALLLLACFAPFVLLKLMPHAEGAIGAAYQRQGAGSAALRSAGRVASPGQAMRQVVSSNWGSTGSKPAGQGGGSGAAGVASKSGGPARGAGRAAAGRGGEGAAASGATAAGVAAAPIAASAGAVKAARGAASKRSEASTAKAPGRPSAAAGPSSQPSAPVSAGPASEESGGSGEAAPAGGRAAGKPPRPPAERQSDSRERDEGQGASRPAVPRPEPIEATGGEVPAPGSKPARPSGEAEPRSGGES